MRFLEASAEPPSFWEPTAVTAERRWGRQETRSQSSPRLQGATRSSSKLRNLLQMPFLQAFRMLSACFCKRFEAISCRVKRILNPFGPGASSRPDLLIRAMPERWPFFSFISPQQVQVFLRLERPPGHTFSITFKPSLNNVLSFLTDFHHV